MPIIRRISVDLRALNSYSLIQTIKEWSAL